MRYDSFYVSTNGYVTLANRRYKYDLQGNRRVPEGAANCYDIMSADWFTRARQADDGRTDPTADNYGFMWAEALNRQVPEGLSLKQVAASNVDVPLIAPFWGQGHLSQWNPESEQAEDWGKVFFYRNNAGNKLIIYYVQYVLKDRLRYLRRFPSSVTIAPNNRPHKNSYIGSNAQITLDRVDSSITVTYTDFTGGHAASGSNPSYDMYRWNTISGLYCMSRHQRYNSKTQRGTYPWDSRYPMYTTYFENMNLMSSYIFHSIC